MAFRLALNEKGYHVTIAPNYDAAIETICKNHFDLVITDLIPVLERTKEGNPETMGILVLATRNKWDPISRILRSSPDDCLFKPFESAELEMSVDHCLEKLNRLRENLRSDGCEESLNEKLLNMTKVMAHDIRGSLISISATLKLLRRGHYGKMDEEVLNRVNELSSEIIGLIGITEEHLPGSFLTNDDSETETPLLPVGARA
jgi:DNA-binding NtrC family response regulator